MPVAHGSYDWYYFIPLNITWAMLLLVSEAYQAKMQTPELIIEKRLMRVMCFLAVLYPILSAILKYRAAYHRKIRKWQQFNNDTKKGSSLKIYLKELLQCEAKMAPVSHPFFSDIWHSVCYIAAWILFPRPVVCVYLLKFGLSFQLVLLLFTGYQKGSVKDTDSFVYNGQHYRYVLRGTCYSGFEDEDQNMLYYPTDDLCGLIPFGNQKMVDQ
ncbi:hypothetical protein PSACC_02190 [Paramicrosporidium saccamoebae]|uniref:Uncharacterized protein n=1 Tax=Paramicrosporidium saccamoebae TaxID=1246581 RepID=A0A2H9TJH7_9FUNG|nr:hypothetical protein PSACC_02190 [Paramicrosporidium saccamoebae]